MLYIGQHYIYLLTLSGKLKHNNGKNNGEKLAFDSMIDGCTDQIFTKSDLLERFGRV